MASGRPAAYLEVWIMTILEGSFLAASKPIFERNIHTVDFSKKNAAFFKIYKICTLLFLRRVCGLQYCFAGVKQTKQFLTCSACASNICTIFHRDFLGGFSKSLHSGYSNFCTATDSKFEQKFIFLLEGSNSAILVKFQQQSYEQCAKPAKSCELLPKSAKFQRLG